MFQHLIRLLNVLSSFPAVYELLADCPLPTKQAYSVREIPDTMPVCTALCRHEFQNRLTFLFAYWCWPWSVNWCDVMWWERHHMDMTTSCCVIVMLEEIELLNKSVTCETLCNLHLKVYTHDWHLKVGSGQDFHVEGDLLKHKVRSKPHWIK